MLSYISAYTFACTILKMYNVMYLKCCFVYHKLLYMYRYFVLPVAATAEQLVVKGQNHGAVDPTVHGGWTERLRDNNQAG